MTGLPAVARIAVLRALRSRPFALLWIGQTISALGDGAFTLALAWAVVVRTGSATALGSVLVARSVPMLIFLLIGGVAADRVPRRMVMLASDGGRAVAVLLIALLSWLGALQFWHLLVLSVVFGVADGFFMPAYQSIAPELVAVDTLPSANSLTGLSRQLSVLLGPLVGAALVATTGVQAAFAFDGLTFVASALCLLTMRLPPSTRSVRPAEDGTPVRRGAHGMVGDVRDGLRYIRASSWLWVTIVLAAVFNMSASGAQAVVLPTLIRTVYHANVGLFGALATVGGIGAISTTVAVGQMRQLHHRGVLAYAGLGLASSALIAYGLPLPRAWLPFMALGASVVSGAGAALFGVIWQTVLQELVPADKLGRVSSVDLLGSFALLPLGYALAGVLADHIGPAWVFIAAGSANLAFTVIGLGVRGIRTLE